MKKILIALSVLFLLGSFTLPPKKNVIFNGKDLSGWKIYGTELWYVDKGQMVCESGPDKEYGYLATDKFYKDFDFTVEFLQESNGNSGIFFRSTIEGTKIAGWQCEVAPLGHDSGGIYESYGRGWLKQIDDDKENVLKPGKWNKMRILVVGDRVQTWLNGVPRVDITDAKIGKANGSIALQIHSGGGIKVRWRKFKIQEL
jgi:3-keto-disaccharide hydrolase